MKEKAYRALLDDLPSGSRPLVIVLEYVPGKECSLDLARWRFFGRPSSKQVHLHQSSPGGTGLIDANREQLILELFECLQAMSYQSRRTTVWTYANSAVAKFFEYLDCHYTRGEIGAARDIDEVVITGFLQWLTEIASVRAYSEGSVKNFYTGVVAVLHRMADLGYMREDAIPPSPFLGYKLKRNPPAPYSRAEMGRIMLALESDIRSIRSNSIQLDSEGQKLSIYVAYMAALTGRNTSSLLMLRRDCLVSHPLREDRALLVYEKARSSGRYAIPVARAEHETSADISETVPSSTADLIEEVITRTSGAANNAPEKLSNRLWVYRENTPRGTGSIKVLGSIHRAMRYFQRRHELWRDDATVMVPTIALFRKTMAVALNSLNGNDVTASARAMRHTRQIHAANYAPVSGQMLRAFKFCGASIEALARGKQQDEDYCRKIAGRLAISLSDAKSLISGEWNTGVGRCNSPYQGRFSEKNGSPCTKFLHCFRCPNFVVSGEPADLHRLFSFYWLLVKERNRLGPSPWKRVYRNVVRIIDEQISTQFDEESIKTARATALANPHPMWKTGVSPDE